MKAQCGSAIPSFFRGRKYNGRLALRRGESRVTSLEARVRRLQLSERGRAMLNAGPWSCPFAPHEGQKAWKSGRSQNEGIPEDYRLFGLSYFRAKSNCKRAPFSDDVEDVARKGDTSRHYSTSYHTNS